MTGSQRQVVQRHAKLQLQQVQREVATHPALFRLVARLSADDELSLAQRLQPWQVKDIEALDAGWLQLAGRVGDCQLQNANCQLGVGAAGWPGLERRQERNPGGADPGASLRSSPGHSLAGSHPLADRNVCSTGQPVRRAYIERARGHSKTCDMALQIAWILLAARRPVRGMVAAADRDQARLIHRAVKDLAAANPWLLRSLSFVENEVRCTRTGSTLEVLSSDVGSSWGALPDFVICDELCHWDSPELWHSLLSSAAKQPECLLVVLTNAGIGRSWQWEVREHARKQPGWYFSSLAGSHAPWIDETAMAEQRALLPPAVYARLWLNEWQHSDGQFVSLAEAQACRDESLSIQPKGDADTQYFAAVDYAEKHDLTVGCVVHQEQDRIVVDRMDVVQPTPDRPTRVDWVEEWIEDVAARFVNTRFVLDEHQLVGTIQKLEGWHDIVRFDFSAGRGNHRLALRLRQLILHRLLRWYPRCGEVICASGRRDDLETELASLLLRTSEGGRVRIDHVYDGVHHDDRAFALGAACLLLSEQMGGGPDLFVVTPPGRGGFW